MSEVKLTPAQVVAVAFFAQNESGTVQEIASFIGKKPQAAAPMLKSLVAKGVVDVKDGVYTKHVEAEQPAEFDDMLAVAAARREAGKQLEITPSGKVAKMVRITLDLRITTDGEWAVVRNGEGDTAWTLFKLDGPGYQVRGQFPTCTAALRVEDGVLSPAPKEVTA